MKHIMIFCITMMIQPNTNIKKKDKDISININISKGIFIGKDTGIGIDIAQGLICPHTINTINYTLPLSIPIKT